MALLTSDELGRLEQHGAGAVWATRMVELLADIGGYVGENGLDS